MKEKEIIIKLADLLNVDQDVLKPETELESIDSWDSLAALSLIVLLEDEFNLTDVDGQTIKAFKTIQDIINITEQVND